MQVKMEFTNHNGVRKCAVPTGLLVIVRVPGQGLQGYHKPNDGRCLVMVPTGKHRTLAETQEALVKAWRDLVGLDEIRSFV